MEILWLILNRNGDVVPCPRQSVVRLVVLAQVNRWVQSFLLGM